VLLPLHREFIGVMFGLNIARKERRFMFSNTIFHIFKFGIATPHDALVENKITNPLEH